MKKIILILGFLATCQFSWSQQELNNYKYVIVPKHFDFQKSADSYQINSLTKFLINKKGFQTIFDDQVYPNELMTNQCLALKVNLLKESNFMRTKIKVAFTDCQNETVYISKEGISKLKDYKKSYHEAIRRAFNTFDNFQYSYIPKKEVAIKKVPLVKKTPKPVVVVKEAKKVQVLEKKDIVVKPLKEKNIKQLIVVKKHLEKKIEKPRKEKSIVGLYNNENKVYEIAAFKKYYIFSRRITKGNSFQTMPLGFIYKTSKKGSYLVKTTDTFTGYLLEDGNFVIDKIGTDGTIKSTTYIKTAD